MIVRTSPGAVAIVAWSCLFGTSECKEIDKSPHYIVTTSTSEHGREWQGGIDELTKRDDMFYPLLRRRRKLIEAGTPNHQSTRNLGSGKSSKAAASMETATAIKTSKSSKSDVAPAGVTSIIDESSSEVQVVEASATNSAETTQTNDNPMEADNETAEETEASSNEEETVTEEEMGEGIESGIDVSDESSVATMSPTGQSTAAPTSSPTTSNSTIAPTPAISSSPTNSPTLIPTTTTTTTVVPQATVQLLHLSAPNECVAYDSSKSPSAVFMIECTTTFSGTELDHWEILSVSTNLFLLRHKASQLCIPKNPEHPDLPFDCFRYSGDGEAIADSINGLIDCNTDFAATIRLDSDTGSLFLYNTDCLTEMEDPGRDTDVIFMSYQRQHGDNHTQVVMWGERILMNMTHLVEAHNFQASWTLVGV